MAAMASASDESPGGESTMNGDVLRGVGARNQTPWGNRIEQGANDRRTWHDTEQRAEHAQRPEATAPPAAEDPKRALKHELQNDLSRMSLLLERFDDLLSA